MIGPYICFEDIDSKVEDGPITRQHLLQSKFVLQRPFLEDSTKNVNPRAVNEFNEFCSNIITFISLPSSIEFDLFQSFSKNVDEEHEDLIDRDL